MPFDFESMLSSSPPGFELNLDIRNSFVKADEQGMDERKNQLQFATKARWYAPDRTIEEEPNANAAVVIESDGDISTQRTQPGICWSNEETSRRISDWKSYYDSEQTVAADTASSAESGRPASRKVSFADLLESVLVIDESPADPPWTLCCQDDVDDELPLPPADDEVASRDQVRLEANFTPPAAHYLAFRSAVETRFVSLANVIIKSRGVLGTVRVKNISFEKSVVVRYTFDGWATHSDVAATHQPDDDYRFDTFTFLIDCPPSRPPGTRLHFAVRYSVAGADYWDSNGGDNYEVVYVAGNSAENYDRQFRSPDSVFSHGQSNYLWSEYSGWSDIDNASPYW